MAVVMERHVPDHRRAASPDPTVNELLSSLGNTGAPPPGGPRPQADGCSRVERGSYTASPPPPRRPRVALQGKGPQRRPQKRLDKRLGAVTVGYKCH